MAQLDFLTSATNAAIPVSMHPIPSPIKADDAYRTISEVSEEIDVPQHVLRFWESNFPQVKPSRMRGSRRYYRPADVEILKTIKTLLYDKGYTIKGAKEVIRGKQELVNMPAMAPVVKAQAVVAQPVEAPKKEIDKKSLVSELRVLKSMLTSLL